MLRRKRRNAPSITSTLMVVSDSKMWSSVITLSSVRLGSGSWVKSWRGRSVNVSVPLAQKTHYVHPLRFRSLPPLARMYSPSAAAISAADPGRLSAVMNVLL